MTQKKIKLKTINNQQLVGDGNITIESGSNVDIVTNTNGWNSTTSDSKVPSEKLVKNSLDNKLDKIHSSYKGKNVVTNSSTGAIEFEDKPTIPSASSTTPSADTTSGSYGSGTSYARSNHTHPKSSLYAESNHTHTSSQITDLSIPSKTSDLTNDGDGTNAFVKTNDSRLSDSRTPTSHVHGNLQNNGQVGSTAQANKNVVTDSSGKITTEDKPTIPSASSTTPSADTTSGSVGTGTTWARSNHTHPKSSLYAEATHNHTKSQITDFPTIPDVSGKEDSSNKMSSWSNTPTDVHYPSEKLVKESIDSVLYKTEELTLGSPTTSSNVEFSYGDSETLSINTLNSLYLPSPSNISGDYDYVVDVTFPNEEWVLIFGGYMALFSNGYYIYCGYVDWNNQISVRESLPNVGNSIIIQKSEGSNYNKIRILLNNDNSTFIDGTTSDNYFQYSSNITINSITAQQLNIPTRLSRYVDDISTVKMLADGADLDKIYDNGIYLGYNGSTNISNCPVQNIAFVLINRNITSPDSSYIQLYQILMSTIGGGDVKELWVRFHNESTNWSGGWERIPSETELNSKEDPSNKVTSWSSTITDTHYPSEKLVKNSLDKKVDKYIFFDYCDNSANITNYTQNGDGSLSIQNDADYYYAKITSQGTTSWSVNNLNVPNRVKISADCYMNNTANPQVKFMLYDSTLQNGYCGRIVQNTSQINLMEHTLTTEGSSINSASVSTSTRTWYTIEFIIDENSLTFNLYDSSKNLMKSVTGTGNLNLSSTNNTVAFGVSFTANSSAYIRNFNVESLSNLPTKTSDLTNDSGFITSSAISGKEDSSNKVASWSSTTTDAHYPSEKLTKDSLDAKLDLTPNLTYAQATGNNDEILCITYSDGKIHKTQAIKANWVKEPVAHSGTGGIGSASGDSQWTINTNINTRLVDLTANKVNTSDIADNLTTNDATKVLSAKQGKALNDLIGSAITYINQ